MYTRLSYLISYILLVAMATGATAAGVAYPAPDEWWTYIYTGNAAGAALDGTWDHDNGSDQWDGTEIGTGLPGGVSALSEDSFNFVRLQETGDPRDHGESDPSNRKIYFGHSLTDELPAEVADSILDNGVTISFRTRLATTPPLDELHPAGGGATSPWPDDGDGYVIHDGGKGNFGICQDGPTNTISFCLALASDDDELNTNGLVMNKLNGTSPSGDVDLQGDEPGTVNILPIEDPTVWHEFWINIEADNSGQGTHIVTIYVDGDASNSTNFHVTAGSSSDLTGTCLALGVGATPQSGAIDVDFFAYKEGILTPSDINKASNPIPGDSAMVEDVWASLNWVPGASAASHDIYFGENFKDVNEATQDSELFRGNHTDTFFVAGLSGFPYPDGLVPGTTYYWRVDEIEENGTTVYRGNVWSFTVPPKQAYDAVPADGAEFVDLDVQLKWTAGFGAKLHYVIFGDNFEDVNEAAIGTTQGAAIFSPGTLKLAKTYYWRVDEFDGTDTYKGQVWSFTTEGAVSGPNPADDSVNVSPTQVLTWDAGAVAASHNIYFGTEADAVAGATTASPEYKGLKALGEESYYPGKLQFNTTYYWRIEEVNDANPDSPWPGNVWSFTTGDFFVIDDFETYNANDNQIWFTWHDGLGYGVPGTDPYFAGNGTGSAVGDETTASYTEEAIVHSGSQLMPLAYDNNKQGFAKYSEAELTLSDIRDWTAEGVSELSLWFRGYPGSVGSFVESPVGTYTITATGEDIFGTADEFHYVFKTLTGTGSITARVESVEQTDPWAKAGVMIRETLSPGSKFAAVYITPTNPDGTATNGCRYQARIDADAEAVSDTSVATDEQMAITAPYWIKLERDVAGNFKGYYSSNGSTWQQMSWNPRNIPMTSMVYIGLALTAHNPDAVCEARFSNVTMTGTVSQQWMNQDIGLVSNDAEPLYVAVSNSTGTPAVVEHEDSAAAQIDTWTEWVIPLSAFADQGIDLTNVDRIAIGLGTRGNMTIPGGSGKMFFDDIRLYCSREAAE